MAEKTKDTSIHAKKYYRVILNSIEGAEETTESFAIKMSMRMRTPLPRVMMVLRNLPCTIKSGLSIGQANKLSSIVEELGGKVTTDSYFLTPGEDRGQKPARKYKGDISLHSPYLAKEGDALACPSCGWEQEEGAEYCALCLASFKEKSNELEFDIQELLARENPLSICDYSGISSRTGFASWVSSNRWLMTAAAAAILLLFLIIKK